MNRPRESRGSQPSACFLVTFCTTQKVTSRFPYGKVSRFCEPRFSSPQWRLRTNKIKTFPKGESRFSKPRFSPPKQQLSTNKIKSFCRSAAFAPPCGGLFLLFVKHNFCKAQKVGKKLCNFPVSLKHGRLAHVRSQFSLFRRSPTHKNLPLATFCTSEQKVYPCRDGTLRVLFRRPSAALYRNTDPVFVALLAVLLTVFAGRYAHFPLKCTRKIINVRKAGLCGNVGNAFVGIT